MVFGRPPKALSIQPHASRATVIELPVSHELRLHSILASVVREVGCIQPVPIDKRVTSLYQRRRINGSVLVHICLHRSSLYVMHNNNLFHQAPDESGRLEMLLNMGKHERSSAEMLAKSQGKNRKVILARVTEEGAINARVE
jgi:hypothetical protein